MTTRNIEINTAGAVKIEGLTDGTTYKFQALYTTESNRQINLLFEMITSDTDPDADMLGVTAHIHTKTKKSGEDIFVKGITPNAILVIEEAGANGSSPAPTPEIDKPLNYHIYSVNSGEQNSWSPIASVVSYDNDTLSFAVGGDNKPLIATFIDGEQKTFSEIADVTVPHDDIETNYHAFLTKDGTVELYPESEINTVRPVADGLLLSDIPEDWNNTVAIDISKYPWHAYIINGDYSLTNIDDKIYWFSMHVLNDNSIADVWSDSMVNQYNYPSFFSGNVNANFQGGIYNQFTTIDEDANYYAEIVFTSGYMIKYGKTTVPANDTFTTEGGMWFNSENIAWIECTNPDVTVEIPEDNFGQVKLTNNTASEQYAEWRIEGFGV